MPFPPRNILKSIEEYLEKTTSKRICVIIPAYNAASTIASVIKGALKYVPEVIVADDGSEDNTSEIAKSAGADVIKITNNKGKGNALKLLFAKAMEKGCDAVISMDADAQHDPEEIPSFMRAHIERPDDIIVGSRMSEKEKIPRARYNSMHVARFYISLGANQFIEDTQCGFRLYPLRVIRNMNLFTERYVTETEILMKAGDMGTTIRFINIRAIYNEGGSHFKAVTDVAKITAYVISYITVKWLIEGLSSNPCTYNKDNSIRDFFSKTKTGDFIFQTITAVTTLPIPVFFYIEYVISSLLGWNNFMSMRKLNKSFFPITLATQMLPVLLVVSIAEKLLNPLGFRIRFVDRLILQFYPHLWDS